MDTLIHIICFFLLTTLLQILHCQPLLPQTNLNYSLCKEQSYNCGDQLSNISYPFWGHNRPSHCGGGDLFYLNCFEDQRKNFTSTILLGSQNFTVLNINLTTNTIKMRRTDLAHEVCTPKFNDTYLSPNIFQFPARTHNISIFYDCSSDVMSYANYQSLCGSQNAICFEDPRGMLLEQIPELKECGKHIIVQADFAFVPASLLLILVHLEVMILIKFYMRGFR